MLRPFLRDHFLFPRDAGIKLPYPNSQEKCCSIFFADKLIYFKSLIVGMALGVSKLIGKLMDQIFVHTFGAYQWKILCYQILIFFKTKTKIL